MSDRATELLGPHREALVTLHVREDGEGQLWVSMHTEPGNALGTFAIDEIAPLVMFKLGNARRSQQAREAPEAASS